MSETWKRWEGRTVEGRIPLQSYLGGSDHSAVFLSVRQSGAGASEKAAIKLIPADMADAERQLGRWKSARELTHPNLIRIYEAGRCELDGTALLYVVEEYAEENLSQILPERALTAEETQGMLPPVLRALQFLHDKGFAHGHIQPSNILAVGDQVKLSSDAVSVRGEKSGAASSASPYAPPEAARGEISAAADVWQLGMTLIEVLTQRLPVWDRARSSAPEVPAAVPQPFREIAGRCLQVDAGKRWSVAEVRDRLEGKPAPTSVQSAMAAAGPVITGQETASAKWPYWLGLAAMIAVVVFLIARPKPSNPPAEIQSVQTQPGAASANPQATATTTPREPKPSAAMSEDTKAEGGATGAGGDEKASANGDGNGVVRRVLPQVSPSARRTIHGKIVVKVKAKVDGAGNVEAAKLESDRGSKYFNRVALAAARDWKFSPAQSGESGAREWKLQFAFSRARTEASAARAKP
jgi:TonB family protein